MIIKDLGEKSMPLLTETIRDEIYEKIRIYLEYVLQIKEEIKTDPESRNLASVALLTIKNILLLQNSEDLEKTVELIKEVNETISEVTGQISKKSGDEESA